MPDNLQQPYSSRFIADSEHDNKTKFFPDSELLLKKKKKTRSSKQNKSAYY